MTTTATERIESYLLEGYDTNNYSQNGRLDFDADYDLGVEPLSCSEGIVLGVYIDEYTGDVMVDTAKGGNDYTVYITEEIAEAIIDYVNWDLCGWAEIK